MRLATQTFLFLGLALSACGDTKVDSSADSGSSSSSDAAVGDTADAANNDDTTFIEEDGYIVMEMESAEIPGGHEWQIETDLSDYTGAGYYRFTGNNICSGPAQDPLRYDFTTVTERRFELRLRAAKIAHCVEGAPQANGQCTEEDRTCDSLGEPAGDSCGAANQCIRTDITNDAFVYIEDANGEYVSFVDQPQDSIGSPTKLFGGQINAWGWTGVKALDPGGPKKEAHWDLPPGVYTLVIQGRSSDFRIDRLALFDSVDGTVQGLDERAETRP